MSWDASTTVTTRPSLITSAAWSPCDRFIAITWVNVATVDVLDSATLQRLQALESPQDVSTQCRMLAFSPDSRILTCCSGPCSDPPSQGFAVSWDLQTSGVVNVVRLQPNIIFSETCSITYSMNGKMAGVLHRSEHSEHSTISVIDIASGVLMDSHSFDDTELLSRHIWTHGESLRFASANAMTITIWEVGFTPGATPTEVDTFPTPVDFDSKRSIDAQLHHAPFRLAFVSRERILVWDARGSRYLLEYTDTAAYHPTMTFSSDGRFFACSTVGPNIYLWKESPAGYIPHSILASRSPNPIPILAQNGESIVAFGGCAIQLWRTKSSTTPPSSILARAPRRTEDFILEISSDGLLAAVAVQGGNTVMILNLTSGVPRLTIDANMEIYGLGVVGSTAVVIGDRKVITWDLPAGDCVPGARVGLERSSCTTNFRNRSEGDPLSASISSDSRHIANSDGNCLFMYSASTGGLLWEVLSWESKVHFSPDGRDVWTVDPNCTEVKRWNVESGLEVSEPLVDVGHPLKGHPWASSRGYRVTSDWWVLGPDGKRLLMLPPPWQHQAVHRRWKGQFLTLLHGGLPEPVILELEMNCDL